MRFTFSNKVLGTECGFRRRLESPSCCMRRCAKASAISEPYDCATENLFTLAKKANSTPKAVGNFKAVAPDPEINALSLSRSNLIGALFDPARDVGDTSGICARQHVTLNLRRHVCEIVGLGMRIPDRDQQCREYHGTQESHCNPSRVAIQSRNCLKGAGQSHRQCRDSDGATDSIMDSASLGVSP
jgi:hypothetical protein